MIPHFCFGGLMEHVDYIVPLCNMGGSDCSNRIKTLNHAMERFIDAQKDVKVTVVFVEQILNEVHPAIIPQLKTDLGISIRQITVKHPIFNKGWLYNIRARNAVSDNLILTESDIFVPNDMYFNNLLLWVKKHNTPWAFGWNKICYVNAQNTDLFFKGNKLNYRDYDRVSSPNPGSTEGGTVYFKKDFYFNSLGGASEFFLELGGIDNEIIRRAQKVSQQYLKFPQTIAHLWHPTSNVKNGKHRSDNRTLYHYTRLRPAVVTKFIKSLKVGTKEGPLSDKFCINDIVTSDPTPPPQHKYNSAFLYGKNRKKVVKVSNVSIKKPESHKSLQQPRKIEIRSLTIRKRTASGSTVIRRK